MNQERNRPSRPDRRIEEYCNASSRGKVFPRGLHPPISLGGKDPADHDLPTLEQIREAGVRIRPHIWLTPTVHVESAQLYLKMECWQRTGSFKVRGAFSKLLTLDREQLARGVVTASAGNHGIGVAEAARYLGVECHVFLPEGASAAKLTILRNLGAQLHIAGRDYDECEAEALRWAERTGVEFIHPFDDPAVISGQGTLALEMLEQIGPAEAVFVPIGGGGLIAGVSRVLHELRPEIQVIGAQPEACPAMLRSLEAGRVVETPCFDTIADGLAGRFVGERTLRACQLWVDEVMLVEESEIRRALRWLLDTLHVVVEGSAAVGVAAALRRPELRPAAVVLTGRNIDTRTLLNAVSTEE
jgi:threonine dehydratase